METPAISSEGWGPNAVTANQIFAPPPHPFVPPPFHPSIDKYMLSPLFIFVVF